MFIFMLVIGAQRVWHIDRKVNEWVSWIQRSMVHFSVASMGYVLEHDSALLQSTQLNNEFKMGAQLLEMFVQDYKLF